MGEGQVKRIGCGRNREGTGCWQSSAEAPGSWPLDWLLIDEKEFAEEGGEGHSRRVGGRAEAQQQRRLLLLCRRLVWLYPEQAGVRGGWSKASQG